MKFRIVVVSLVFVLAGILAFGSLVHALLPHQHSGNETVTSLLHSALRHEDKQLSDVVPPAPLFASAVIAIVSTLAVRTLVFYMLRARLPALAPLRRGILLYQRFS